LHEQHPGAIAHQRFDRLPLPIAKFGSRVSKRRSKPVQRDAVQALGHESPAPASVRVAGMNFGSRKSRAYVASTKSRVI